MAPMRDLICGISELLACAMTPSPRFIAAGAKSPISRDSYPAFCGNLAQPGWCHQLQIADGVLTTRNASRSGLALRRCNQPLPERRQLWRIGPARGRDQIEP